MWPHPTSSNPTRALNPLAPEYNPIPPGVYPLPPPPAAAFHFPPPPQPQLFYAPPHEPFFSSTSYVNQNYTNTYYLSPQPPLNPASMNTHTTSTANPVRTATDATATRQVQPSIGFPGQTIVGPRSGGRGRRGFKNSNKVVANERSRVSNDVNSTKDKQNRYVNNNNNKDRSRDNKLCHLRGKDAEISNRAHQRINDRPVMPLVRGEQKTTIMIKNIPYACPRAKLIDFLDGFCMRLNDKRRNQGNSASPRGADADDEHNDITAYDFLYLPFDFRTKNSRGFAFVNFTNPKAAWDFFVTFHQEKWEFAEWSDWPKRIEVVSAKIQGKSALVNHFAGSIFQCWTNEFLPVGFDPARDGTKRPVQFTVIGNRCKPFRPLRK